MMRKLFVLSAMMLLLVCCRHNGTVTEDMSRYGLVEAAESFTVSDEDGAVYKVEFNSGGRVARILKYLDRIDDPAISEFTYRNGNLVEMYQYETDGMTSNRQEFEYEGHRLTCSVSYGLNNEERDRWVYNYIDSTRMELYYYNEGDLLYHIFRDIDVLTVSDRAYSVIDSTLVGTSRTVYFDRIDGKTALLETDAMTFSIDYDEAGLPIHSVNAIVATDCSVVWDPSLEEYPERWYEYEYDSHGNWIERRDYKSAGGEAEAVYYRSIKY